MSPIGDPPQLRAQTALMLGINVPAMLLARAEHVID